MRNPILPASASSCSILLLLAVFDVRCADARRRNNFAAAGSTVEPIDEGLPAHWSAKKKKEIQAAIDAEKHERDQRVKRGLPLLPIFPTHATVCDGRQCRPGEGNMKHSTEIGVGGEWRYKQWTQPYEHREWYVQSRSRKMPHGPDAAHYG